ncbi:MAG: excinuclease ABC subunit UvrC, partial [Dehalococcoidia bacterium]|nr:excinuclease ABC subunit UvrC [Dehalococcoidia bacterium]
AAERMEFERAAMVRDQLKAVERTIERQTVATTRKEDADIFGIARSDDQACVQVFFIRGTQMVGRDHFIVEGARDETDSAVLGSFLEQYYESAQYIPKLVAVAVEPAERNDIEAMLSEKRESQVEVRVPARGEKLRLIEMANENARETLDMLQVKWLADATKTDRALEQLQEELALPEPPGRIECYDNSNIQGSSPVSSMVVFENGRPATSQYRRFRVKTVEGADDFATMQEVLRRRFRRAGKVRSQSVAVDGEVAELPEADDAWDLPDLVIIDGGKGQLSAAVEAMREIGVYDIPTVGLAKQHEELFVPGEPAPVILPRGSDALYLVQRIRDEAHRFAITYHRQLRGKSQVSSALDNVPGIGPKRKKALLRRFGSVKAVREASVEEVAATVGFTEALAGRVKDHL